LRYFRRDSYFFSVCCRVPSGLLVEQRNKHSLVQFGADHWMPHVRCWTIIACAVPLLTSCASYKPAPIDPAQNADAIQARSLDDPRLQKFTAAAGGKPAPVLRIGAQSPWGLTTLTLAAVYYHPNLDIARAKLAAARAAVITARQVPNPSLSFEQLSYNLSVPTPSPWTVAPFVNFLIETFGKREYRTGQARALVDAARDDLNTVSWQVRGECAAPC
jgi:cobalt-zinc-cadmium efflux system outer membrane protein